MDEFLESAGVIFVAITGLLILLTYLEASLLQPRTDRRPRRGRRFRVRRGQ